MCLKSILKKSKIYTAMAKGDVKGLFHRWRVMISTEQQFYPTLISLVKVKPLWSFFQAAITLPLPLSCQGEPTTKKCPFLARLRVPAHDQHYSAVQAVIAAAPFQLQMQNQ